MKRTLTIIAALTWLATVAACADEIGWHESFEAAQQAAQGNDKPIMADFWGPGCGACDMLDEHTYTDPAVIAKAGEFEAVKVNTRVEYDVSTRYAIAFLPTIHFMTPGGVVVRTVPGFALPEPFLEEMTRALEACDAFKLAAELEPKFAENPDDAGLALQIAEAYRLSRQFDKAAHYAAKVLELAGDDAEIRLQALLIRGRSLVQTGEPGEAVEPLSAFVAENPDSEDIWDAKLYLGFAYLQVRQGDKGVPLLQEIVDNTAEDARVHVIATRLLAWQADMSGGTP